MMKSVNAADSSTPGRTAQRAAPRPDTEVRAATGARRIANVRNDIAGRVSPDGLNAQAARLVWGVVTAALDPLSATAIGQSAAVAPQAAREALERLENAGLVLRIPRDQTKGGAPQDLWVMADAVGEAPPAAMGRGPTTQDAASATPSDTAADARVVRMDTALEAVLPFPTQLPGARPGHRRVWSALIGSDRALRTVEVAEAAGISRSAAASALAALARVRAVRRFREGGSDNWQLPPASLAARDRALGTSRSSAPSKPKPATSPGPDSVSRVHRASGLLPPSAESAMGEWEVPVGAVSGLRRLRKGELEAMVLRELRRRYPRDYGPMGLSHLLGGYSSGAITNALTRLTVKSLVQCTCEAPKRYRATPCADETRRER